MKELNQHPLAVRGRCPLAGRAGPSGRAGGVWTGSPRQKGECVAHRSVAHPGGLAEGGGGLQAGWVVAGQPDDASIAAHASGSPRVPTRPVGGSARKATMPDTRGAGQERGGTKEPCERDTLAQRQPRAPETNPALGSGPGKAQSLTPTREPRKEGGPVTTLAGWQRHKVRGRRVRGQAGSQGPAGPAGGHVSGRAAGGGQVSRKGFREKNDIRRDLARHKDVSRPDKSAGLRPRRAGHGGPRGGCGGREGPSDGLCLL